MQEKERKGTEKMLEKRKKAQEIEKSWRRGRGEGRKGYREGGERMGGGGGVEERRIVVGLKRKRKKNNKKNAKRSQNFGKEGEKKLKEEIAYPG